jgi:hypothetical protein
VNQHKQIEERITAALDFQRDYSYRIPLVMDTMANDFNSVYASWPLRYYVVQPSTGKLIYKAQPSDSMYHLEQLCSFLDHYLEKKK